jgi:hypothetical protein
MRRSEEISMKLLLLCWREIVWTSSSVLADLWLGGGRGREEEAKGKNSNDDDDNAQARGER